MSRQAQVGWLNMFNTEFVPEEGSEISGDGAEGDNNYYITPHCHHQNDSALRWTAVNAC